MQTAQFNTSLEQCEYALNPAQIILSLCTALVAAQCKIATNYLDNTNFDNVQQKYDFIVIGAGSGGATVASKLAAENPNWRILLVEAGGTPPLQSYITPSSPRIYRTHHDWKFTTSENSCAGCPDSKCYWPAGRMLGGSSSLGIQLIQIGNENNYDEWARLTQSSTWKWDSVREYFQELLDKVQPETFEKSEGYHYKDIVQMRNLLIGAAKNLGFDEITSIWDQIQSRVGYQRSYGMTQNGVRRSVASVFLNQDTERNNNLFVLKKTIVTKILFDGREANGVVIEQNGVKKIVNANKEIILSAGTFNTPKILMLSGIGPENHLKTFGINTIADLPAVGKNLQDHSRTYLFYRVINSNFTITDSQYLDSVYQFFMHQSGPLASHATVNLNGFINTDNRTALYPNIFFFYSYKPIGDPIGLPTLLLNFDLRDEIKNQIYDINKHIPVLGVSVSNFQTKSTGQVQLKSSNIYDNPQITFNFNAHDSDSVTFLKAVRFQQKLLKTKTMQNEFRFEPITFKLDKCLAFDRDSDEYWKCYIKYIRNGAYSAVGTARMGKDSKTSVVTDQLMVHGVERLRIVDGSVIPKIINGYTEFPIMMIGLKAADMIKEKWGHRADVEKEEL